MELLKKIMLSTLILLIIAQLFIPYISFATDTTTSQASTETTIESARAQIANWAISFVNSSEGAKCIYSGSFTDRKNTYRANDPQESYKFDCVGWVSYAINRSLDIDYSEAYDGTGGFVTPQSGIKDTSHFGPVSITEIQPGDILIAPSAPHVGIYIGNNQIIDMGAYKGQDLAIRAITSNYAIIGWSECVFTSAARLISTDGVNFSPIEGGSDVTEGPDEEEDEEEDTGDWDTEEVDLDELADKFNFSGMATTVIKQKQNVDVFRWFFEGIGGFLDYIAGILITIAIKAPILGYTNTILDLVNKFLHGLN